LSKPKQYRVKSQAGPQLRVVPGRKNLRRATFTILELLVVISIIAVLAALLVPTLKSAKDSANQASCMNNLRQIGLGMQMYGDDKGYYVWGYEESAGTDWSYTISPYLEKLSGLTYGPTSGNLRSPMITCPSRGLISTNRVNTYGTHDRLLGNNSGGSPYKGAPLYPRQFPWRERPQDYWMIADAAQNPATLGGESHATIWNILPEMGQNYSDATANSNIANSGNNLDQAGSLGQIRWRHKSNTRANFLMTDGHVESIIRGQMKERQLKLPAGS
jgi:prepilin-type processing-associated H-X9-DG protein